MEPAPESPPSASSPPRSPRWWPAIVILIAAAVALLWVTFGYEHQRQDQNIARAIVILSALVLLLVWCLFLSRFRWKFRLACLGITAGSLGLIAALFRIHGVSGDLVPVLQFRWEYPVSAIPPAAQTTTVARVSATAATLTNQYPQFLGPNRDGTIRQLRLEPDWQAHPPTKLWSHLVGLGWSGFAVAGPLAITQEQRGDEECVIAYDLLSGSPVWSHADAAHFKSTLAGEGPRATPTIVGRRVFALGSTGILNCLDLDSGKLIWTKQVAQDNHAQLNEWGMSCSPLVYDGLVILSVGGHDQRSLVAYREETGAFAWGGGTDGAGYSSPITATLAGVPQILIFNSYGVCSHQPANGTMLWKYHWPGGHPHVSTPIVLPQDRLLISSGYGIGSEVVKIEKQSAGNLTASRVWKSNRLKAKFTNLVFRDGYVYGLDDGIMVCLDAATGQLQWKEGRYGHGQEILIDDLLLVSAESGEIILLEPNPRAPHEVARFSGLEGKTWNPPALAGSYLVVRNDKQAACYQLPLRRP